MAAAGNNNDSRVTRFSVLGFMLLILITAVAIGTWVVFQSQVTAFIIGQSSVETSHFPSTALPPAQTREAEALATKEVTSAATEETAQATTPATQTPQPTELPAVKTLIAQLEALRRNDPISYQRAVTIVEASANSRKGTPTRKP